MRPQGAGAGAQDAGGTAARALARWALPHRGPRHQEPGIVPLGSVAQ